MTTASHAVDQNVAHENTLGTLHKQPGVSNWVAVSWEVVINRFIPLGYQDETGFHHGEQAGAPDGVVVNAD